MAPGASLYLCSFDHRLGFKSSLLAFVTLLHAAEKRQAPLVDEGNWLSPAARTERQKSVGVDSTVYILAKTTDVPSEDEAAPPSLLHVCVCVCFFFLKMKDLVYTPHM